ncbi:MAG: copper amine oxidase [Clostridia bacterium]|nr:MAG: copper amine oxidase [Clostridia bacterium]
MAKKAAAVAGINGGYFTRNGGRTTSIGNIIIDGQLQAAGDLLRPTLGLTKDGRLLVSYLDPRPVLEAGGQEIPVERVNLPYQPGHTHLYTSEWGLTTGTPAGTPELVFDGGPGRFSLEGSSPIPPGGYVISGPAAQSLPAGSPVNLQYKLPPGWEEVSHALTGGPLLVEDGEPVFQAVMEGFTGTIYSRGPRTAIGSDAGGRILLVTVDGRQPGYSEGLILEELALLMVQLGARTAVALDGGGSTEMWVQGRVVNRPSDGSERLLPNGLLVLAQIPVYLNGQRLLFDVPPVIENGRTLVPFRKIFAALGAEVQWREETQQVLATGPGIATGVTVELTVGQNTAYVNGELISLEAAPKITGGRTLVPLRMVSEALGAAVEWDPQGPAIYIRTARGDETPRPSRAGGDSLGQ